MGTGDQPTTSPSSQPTSTYYFAYGSNLSPTQMASRCPSSRPLGLARLPGWKWLINERGYANVVELSSESPPKSLVSGRKEDEGVWGVLYLMGGEADEEALDRCEGVPWAYGREELVVEVEGGMAREMGLVKGKENRGVKLKVLVYVDRERVGDAKPREEYVARMNRGVEEASVRFGLPGEYVERVIRRFIPAV